MSVKNFTVWLVLCCALLSGCGGNSGNVGDATSAGNKPVIWQPNAGSDWVVKTPDAEKIDEVILNQTYTIANQTKGLYSLLVIRNGNLVGESYFNGKTSSDKFQLRSVSKTVMATLIGMAIEQGKIVSIKQPIYELLGNEYASLMADKTSITLEHLLTMTSGISWNENATPRTYDDWENSQNPTQYVLKLPMTATAGTQFNYNSATSHLLSVILTKATGLSTAEYAKRNLFDPLGISDWHWTTLSDGYFNGAAGLQLRTRDLAKLGQFWMQQGKWQQQQLVSSSWITQSSNLAQARSGKYGDFSIYGYGYQWLLVRSNVLNTSGQLAWGFGGQFVMAFPSHNLLFITMAHPRPNDVREQEASIFYILEQLLPSIK